MHNYKDLARYKHFDQFRHHGRFSGPSYSAGKYNASIRELIDTPAIDKVDEAAKEHDMYYALGKSKEGDKQLIDRTNNMYSYYDIFRAIFNPLGAIGNVLSDKTEKEPELQALLLNKTFKLKNALSDLGYEIKNPAKDPRITKKEEAEINHILRMKKLQAIHDRYSYLK